MRYSHLFFRGSLKISYQFCSQILRIAFIQPTAVFTILNIPFFDGVHRFIPALFISLGSKNLYVDVDHRVRKYGTSKYDTFFRLIRGIKDLFKVYLLLKRLKRKEKFD